MDGGVHIGPGDMVLDKYRVERVIGFGGMGFIVAARHVVLDEVFAIKLMLPSFSADREAQERFLREARAAAKIKGDHVARVQDVGCLPDGTSYMIMEYLAGEDLKKVVRKGGPLPIQKAVEYTIQTCKALREAHALGIVHRDIKPANLMLVSRPDGAPRIKVIDFGISKHTAAVLEGLTTSTWAGGSPLYMPPEQILSARSVDGRADVWSVGVVLYELLTGVTPFHATSVAAVMQRVLNEQPVPPSVLRQAVPPALADIVMRCLAKRPEARFQTIGELMEALSDALPDIATDPFEEEAPAPPPARPSLASIPFDTSSLVAPAGAVTAVETPRPSSRPSSTTALGFSQVASVPPARLPEPKAPKRRALQTAAVAVMATLCVTGAGAVWQRLGPTVKAAAVRLASAGEDTAPAASPVPATPLPVSPAAAPVPVASVLPVSTPPATVEIKIPIPGATSVGSAPKAAPGERPIIAPKRSKSTTDHALPSDTRGSAAGSTRRKAEPLY